MSKIRLDKCVLSAKKLKCRIFSASFITKTKSTSKMSQANFLFYASMKMSRKIKKPMNWTAAKNTWRLFCCLYLTFFRQSSKCASHMSNRPKHCNAIRIDATDTEFVTVAKPGNKTNQFWTLAATFSVSEKKNWDGLCHVYWFLSNISSFQSRWVVYGFTGGLTCFVVLLRLQ